MAALAAYMQTIGLLIRRFKAHIMHSYTMLISIAALCAGVDGIDFSVYAAMQHNAS